MTTQCSHHEPGPDTIVEDIIEIVEDIIEFGKKFPPRPQSEIVVAISIAHYPEDILLDDDKDAALVAAITPTHPGEIALVVNSDLGEREYVIHYADGSLKRESAVAQQ